MENYLLQVILIITVHDWLTNWVIKNIFISMVINCYILPYAFSLWKWSWIYVNYHRKIFPSTSCPWTIGNPYEVDIYWSSLHWHLLLISLFLAKVIVLTPMCLPCFLWIHFIYLIMFCALVDIGRVMTLFVCILYSNAKS